MKHQRLKSISAGHAQRTWPAFLLLLVGVVAPTAGVLWFMAAAMRNERLAIHEKLTQAYRPQLQAVVAQMDAQWEERTRRLAATARDAKAPEAFAALATDGFFDGIVIYDKAGRAACPGPARVPEGGNQTPEWAEAERLEFQAGDPLGAAAAYARIAAHSDQPEATARALQAQARSLAKAARREEAIKILTGPLAGPALSHAVDRMGSLIGPNALLFALQLLRQAGPPERPGFQQAAARLTSLISDYRETDLSSGQRLFLMRGIRAVWPQCPPFPTEAAEETAQEFLESQSPRPADSRLAPVRAAAIWAMASADGSRVGLLRRDRIDREMESRAAERIPSGQVKPVLISPVADPPTPEPFLIAAAGRGAPGWRLALCLQGPDPFSAAAQRQIAAYWWTGALIIFSFAALGLIGARTIARQMQLARLKNDLIATVSHELKTPLSSMRVLVDTLLDAPSPDPKQVREYLQLVARENTRLSRLIDNFLTFSRMERNKRTFTFEDVRIEDIVAAAEEVVRERFAAPGCRLEVCVEPGLPPIQGDRDALTTVVLNLLDNAFKYTGDEKRVSLHAHAQRGSLCLAVEDNGMGLSHRAAKRVFDRFYQVDQSLSRGAGGCGLGLSIVKFIVAAHGGSVHVDSQPGQGSVFTVELPIRKDENKVRSATFRS